MAQATSTNGSLQITPDAPLVRLFLLRERPYAEVNGEPVRLNSAPMDLLVYLTLSGTESIHRTALVEALYSHERMTPSEAQKHFRQNVLFRLRQILRNSIDDVTRLLDESQRDFIVFHREQVWADALEFESLANQAMVYIVANETPDETLVRVACDMYEADLYAYGQRNHVTTTLASFINKMRGRLRAYFSHLLEYLVEECVRTGRYEDSDHYAERWRQHDPHSSTPLQYLIWLNITQNRLDLVAKYLSQLEDQSIGQPAIGLSAPGWRTLIANNETTSLELLKLSADASIDLNRLVTEAAGMVWGREDALRTALQTLCDAPDDLAYVLVTGAPGSDKYRFVQALTRTLVSQHIFSSSTAITCTDQTQAQQLYDDLGAQLHPVPMPPDTLSRRYALEQYFAAERCLVVIHVDISSDAPPQILLDFVGWLQAHTALLLASSWQKAPAAWAHHFTHIQLEPFTLDELAAILPDNGNELEHRQSLDKLQMITLGQPLPLHILLHGHRLFATSLSDVLKRLAHDVERDTRLAGNRGYGPAAPYEPLLAWCWSNLSLEAKHIVLLLLQVAHNEALTYADLTSILAERTMGDMDAALDELGNLRLIIEDDQRFEGTIAYGLNRELRPTWEALYKRERLVLEQTNLIREQFILWLDRKIAGDNKEWARLIPYKYTILEALQAAPHTARYLLVWLNRLYSFLEECGFLFSCYSLYLRLAEQQLHEVPDKESTQVLLNFGRLLIERQKPGDLQEAEVWLQRARLQAEEVGALALAGFVSANQGVVANHLQKDADAEKHFSAALDYANLTHDPELLVLVRLKRGAHFFSSQDWEKAQSEYDYLAQKIQDLSSRSRIKVQLGLGDLAHRARRYTLAIEHYNMALDEAKASGILSLQLAVNMNIGISYRYARQYAQAATHYTEALRLAEQINDTTHVYQLRIDQALLQVDGNHFVEAEAELKSLLYALRGCQRANEDGQVGAILSHLGYLYVKQHKFELASEMYRRRLKHAVEHNHPADSILAAYGLCLSHALHHEPLDGLTLDESVRICREALDVAWLVQLQKLEITASQLQQAAYQTHHGLVNYPNLPGYQVDSALAALLEINYEPST